MKLLFSSFDYLYQKIRQMNLQNQLQIKGCPKAKNKPEAYWVVYDPQQTSNNSIQNTVTQQTNISKGQCPQINKLTNILSGLSTTYATFRFMNHIQTPIEMQSIQSIVQSMETQFNKYKLTKRNLVFAILISPVTAQQLSQITESSYFVKIVRFYNKKIEEQRRKSQQQTLSFSPDSSPRKMMKLSRNASFVIGEQIYMNLNKSIDEVSEELIKVMKLDFVWLGVMSRLGTDVRKFQQLLIQEENFDPEYIGVDEKFFMELNTLLFYRDRQNKPVSEETNFENNLTQEIKKDSQSQQKINHDIKQKKYPSKRAEIIATEQLTQMLEQCFTKISSTLINEVNTNIEQLIRSKFNSRVIFNDIVLFGDYLPLLLSRNYFNLLYIETATLVRFAQFKKLCTEKYEFIAKIMTLQNFLTIDDYWYRNFILKSLPNVKFIIDKANQNVPYEQIINKHYKQIIPPFRPTFDQYFLSVCNVLKQRSACLKQAVGSIIVKDKRIVSTGYNGTPVDCINCFNGGCKVCNNSEKMNTEVLSCTCIHAEYGCILQAGIKVTPGSTLYSTKLPCLWCCKLIIQGKICKIVYFKSKYPHLEYQNIGLAKQILAKGKVQLVQVEETKIFTSS